MDYTSKTARPSLTKETTMARWRLTQPHYLNVPGTEWEYKEVDRTTGKQGRKVYPVPLLLSPNEPSDQNYPGEIIVAQGKSASPKDIIFLGEPTPDMEPLDDEAEKISAACAPKWSHPIESLPGSFSASLISNFEKQIASAFANNPTAIASPVSAGSVSSNDFAKLQAQVAELMARNSELETKVKRRA